MSFWAYATLALTVGVVLPFQVGVNARLAEYVGDPMRAALVSFAVGTAILAVVSVLVTKPWPPLARLGAAPWWVWVGGLLGAAYVATSIVAAPRLGAAFLIALVVAGQSLASLVIDHFGWVGFAEHAVSPARIFGAALLVAGVVLIRVF